jgi:cell wall-associated NlpC family hydrolase
MKQLLTGLVLAVLNIAFISCDSSESITPAAEDNSIPVIDTLPEEKIQAPLPADTAMINTKNQSPEDIVSFAKTLIGVPYKYASADPAQGFDCSGFITYVFNHFNIEVPRSSIDFTNVGTPVNLAGSRVGDLILFTGTDSLETNVGHMGIVTENTDSLRFIHSTSGKKYGVTITGLNEYYKKRFVKVIRIF